MKKHIFLAIAFTLAPIASLAEGFNGPYVGAVLGGASAEDKGTEYYRSNATRDGLTSKSTPSGVLYGLSAGYDKTFGNNILLGVAADYEGRGGSSDKAPQKESGVVYDANYSVTSKLTSLASLRVRLGYVIDHQALLYATAGYASARVKRTYHDDYPPAEAESHAKWQDGWTAGVGGEYLFTKNLSAAVEYRYSDFGSDRVDVGLWGARYYEKQKLSEETLRLQLSYRF